MHTGETEREEHVWSHRRGKYSYSAVIVTLLTQKGLFGGIRSRCSPTMERLRCALGSEVVLRGSCRGPQASLWTWTVTSWSPTMTIDGSASFPLTASSRWDLERNYCWTGHVCVCVCVCVLVSMSLWVPVSGHHKLILTSTVFNLNELRIPLIRHKVRKYGKVCVTVFWNLYSLLPSWCKVADAADTHTSCSVHNFSQWEAFVHYITFEGYVLIAMYLFICMSVCVLFA